MAYDKNRGRAAGTPGFYKNIGQTHTRGENTGEWTRDSRPHREGGNFKGGARNEGFGRDASRPAHGEGFGRNGQLGNNARPDNRMHQAQPARGTRNHAISPDRPIYQNAFEDAPHGGDMHRKAPVQRTATPLREPRFEEHRAAPMREPHFEERRPAPLREPRFGRPAPAPVPPKPIPPKPIPPKPPIPPMPAPDPEMAENLIVGRNPIREAIKSGREIERILVQRGELSGSAREIIARARENHIIVQEVDKIRLDAIYPNNQGMIAYASAAHYSTVEDMLDEAAAKGESPFLIVLDGITDPHNLGAIIRSAECAGAHGVIIQQRRSVGLTPAAVKAAAGAAEYMKVAKVVNITRTLQELKQHGIWVVGADMNGQKLADIDLSGAIALVIGSEGDGISRLVKDECDFMVALPMRGHIDSLNASVAAGTLMYAVRAARGD